MIDLIKESVYSRLTTEPQSFSEIISKLKFSTAPVRLRLNALHADGKVDFIYGKSKNGQNCKLYFKCDEVVDQPKVASTLFQVAMSRPWDLNVFAQV
jgi:hypothetical protein